MSKASRIRKTVHTCYYYVEKNLTGEDVVQWFFRERDDFGGLTCAEAIMHGNDHMHEMVIELAKGQ